MEQQPGQDPEHDGPCGPSGPRPGDGPPGPASPGLPDDAGSPDVSDSGASSVAGSRRAGSGTGAAGSGSDSGSGSSDADADARADADADGDGDGVSEFGPWDGLEGTLGAAREREELLAGFAPGGVWDKHPPGPELAVALARAAGPGWRCAAATGEELIGLLRAMAALQSWASAGLLGVIRALIRDDDPPFLGRPRHGDLADAWDDSLVHEIALALAVSAPSAAKTTRAAWELAARLPGIELLLRDGTLDLARARLVAEVFAELSDEDAARAEELLIPRLTEPPRKTYTQIERIATAIAAAVDPGLAERRRQAAEKHRSRVAMFRELSGAAGLSGRDLPADQTLAAFAHLNARARQYQDSGAFPGERIDRLRATAYLDILNGFTADDRIAYGRLSPDDPDPDLDHDGALEEALDGDGPDGDGPGGDGPVGAEDLAEGPGCGGSDCPCDECDGRCTPPDDGEPDDGEPDDGGPGDSGDGGGPGNGGPRGGSEPPVVSGPGHDAARGPEPLRPAPRSPSPQSAGGSPPTLTDLIVPLATLLSHAERPGEGHGLGTLDPALCRALAATAARSPHTTVCVTVTDPEGIAIGHGCATLGRLTGPPGGPPPPPPLVALQARINLTITATRLIQLPAQPELRPPGSSHAAPPGRPQTTGPPGPLVTGWALAPQDHSGAKHHPGDPDWCRGWALTLPSGLQYSVDLAPVPTYDCDHRNESHAYQPNDTLRHLVQIRDHTCTFPPCSRHARDSDFEHAVPYDQGGRTCACNAGARSRRCHRVKQSPGWNVTQPKPGWHQWSTPRGRTYTQGPRRYPV